jgi:hypothetical protein
MLVTKDIFHFHIGHFEIALFYFLISHTMKIIFIICIHCHLLCDVIPTFALVGGELQRMMWAGRRQLVPPPTGVPRESISRADPVQGEMDQ